MAGTDPNDDQVITGTSNGEFLNGGIGNDTINGLGGNDNLRGNFGCDTLYGGSGNDTLYGRSSTSSNVVFTPGDIDSLYGGDGNDKLYLTGNATEAYGGIGDDTFYGSQGTTGIYGGTGIDTLNINTSRSTHGGHTAVFHLGGGVLGGSLHGTGSMGGIENFETYTLDATRSDSLIAIEVYGGDDSNIIEARTSNGATAILHGNGGDDTVYGGFELSSIYGGTGSDTIWGGSEVYGGDHADDIRAFSFGENAIFNTVYGDGGDDTISATGSIYGGDGADTISGAHYIEGGEGNDSIWGGSQEDTTILGGIGNDSIRGSNFNSDHVFGGDGDDQIWIERGDNTIKGGKDNDSIAGGVGQDEIYGGGGDDTIGGGLEADELYGGGGNDVLHAYYSGNGSSHPGDSIFGGKGSDTIFGGSEAYGGDDADTITVGFGTAYGDDGHDTISLGNSATAYGGEGNDTLESYVTTGNATSFTSKYYGEAGLDTITGGTSNDSIYGGEENDLLYGAAGRDTIYGGDGDDTISGTRSNSTFTSDNDSLYGGDGNDTLHAFSSNDTANGGGDDDIFMLAGSGSRLRIDGGEGFDTVNLTAYTTANSVTVDFQTGTIRIKYNNFNSEIQVGFSNIEDFTGHTNILYRGLELKAPLVDKTANNSGNAIDETASRLLKKGSTISFEGELGDGDSQDHFTFFSSISGEASVVSLLGGYKNEVRKSSISIQEGLNTIVVNEGGSGPTPQFYDYKVTISVKGPDTEREKDVSRFLNDNFTGWTKRLLVDNTSLGADLFEITFKHLGSADDVIALFGDIKGALGVVGDLIDIGTKIDVIQAAFRDGGIAAGQRAAFVEVMDFIAGAAASSAGGFAGTFVGATAGLVGAPIGTAVGGVFGGLVYGQLISNSVKEEAKERWDLLYFEATGEVIPDVDGPNGDPAGDAQPAAGDISDYVFDADWYGLTYTDAKAAVEAGEYPNLFAHFLAVGIAAGNLANEDASPLNVEDIALNLDGYDEGMFLNEALFTTQVGALGGDGANAIEQAVFDEIDARSAAFSNFDASVSAVANRIALDWVVNQADQLEDAAFSGGASDWVRQLSNGELYGRQFNGAIGAEHDLDIASTVVAVKTNSRNAEKIVDRMVSNDYFGDVLTGFNARTLGVAEYAGLWVVVIYYFTDDDDPVGLDTSQQVIRNPGTVGADTITSRFAQVIGSLYDGDDILSGSVFSDTVDGGAGDDALEGGRGADVLSGGDNDDTIEGVQGTDSLIGDAGMDTLFGGGGEDTLDGGDDDDILNGGTGADDLQGGKGDDDLSGNAGTDVLRGGGHNDVLRGAGGDDTIYGGSGDDTLLGAANKDALYGDGGDDVLDGAQAQDALFGGNGDDELKGGSGDDTLDGGNNDDVLRGGKGNDLFFGGAGNDRMIGSDGNDDFIFANGFGTDIITDFNALSGAEDIDFSAVTAINSFNDLSNNHMAQSGADVVITVGGNSLTLKNVALSDLDGSDFIF